ncbi:uncharacterized protein BX663DRAFT_549785 [Cokeromyces recurvatus]|uniref:uncharacterized protein n=1 Tax=Cokeromyces recurvatus TaxID=90255 RepID=UPI00221ED690|nr:uncharacterized protein BX663DRAFT_549785 [Cokeromyces recurvatus]KAI7904917.1 hypothetical protein BX663DRAFT_549785 [Cokeromyces recurvatus]
MVLSPIFHDPQKETDVQMVVTESSGNRHPDGGSCEDYVYSARALLTMKLWENVVLLQAVGKFSICCLLLHHDGGFYAVFEVNSIEVPKSILELSGFIMKLDDI